VLTILKRYIYIHRKVGIVIIEALDRFFASWRSFRIHYGCNSKNNGDAR